MISAIKYLKLQVENNSPFIGLKTQVIGIESIGDFINNYKTFLPAIGSYNFKITLDHIKELYYNKETFVFEASDKSLCKKFSYIKDIENNKKLDKALWKYIIVHDDTSDQPQSFLKNLPEKITELRLASLKEEKALIVCNDVIEIPKISETLQRIVNLPETMERVWYYPNF